MRFEAGDFLNGTLYEPTPKLLLMLQDTPVSPYSLYQSHLLFHFPHGFLGDFETLLV